MPRSKYRRKKKTSRKKQGVSLLGLAETYMLLNVATQTMFNNDPVNFIIGKDGGAKYAVGNSTTLNIKEMFGMSQYHGGTGINPTSGFNNVGEVMVKNLQDNWVKGAVSMVLIPLAFRFGKGLARPAISRTNRLLGKVGVAKTVKV